MPAFRPRPSNMIVGRTLGRPSHDVGLAASISLAVKTVSDAATALEATTGLSGSVTTALDNIIQRLDDAEIP